MSAVVILLVVKFSRFRIKDKSENTFIKICLPRAFVARDITKLERILQMTTLHSGSCFDKIIEPV